MSLFKRFGAILLVLAMVASFAACGQTAAPATETPAATDSAAEPAAEAPATAEPKVVNVMI